MLNVRYIKMPEMCTMLRKTPPTIRAMYTKGDFPRPHKAGGTFLGWLESEVEEWMNKRNAQKDAEPPKRGRGRPPKPR